MRELILARIAEIKKTIGADCFRRRKGKLGMGQYWSFDFDFTKLDDAALAKEFERLVAKAYRQR